MIVAEGCQLVEQALRLGRPGAYQLQAAIAAVHAQAASPDETDRAEIAQLYSLLTRVTASPVVEMNRAVAVAMVEGPAAGLAILDQPEVAEQLAEYRWYFSTRAELLRRLGLTAEATTAYQRALDLSENQAERAFLINRLRELGGPEEPGTPGTGECPRGSVDGARRDVEHRPSHHPRVI